MQRRRTGWQNDLGSFPANKTTLWFFEHVFHSGLDFVLCFALDFVFGADFIVSDFALSGSFRDGRFFFLAFAGFALVFDDDDVFERLLQTSVSFGSGLLAVLFILALVVKSCVGTGCDDVSC